MHRMHASVLEYAAINSGMKEWNAALKMLIATSSLVMCISARTYWSLVFTALAMVYTILLPGKTDWRLFLKMLLVPSVFIISGGIAIVIEIMGQAEGFVHLQVGTIFICITKQSLQRMFWVTGRAYTGVLALYMLCFTVSISEMIYIFRKMKIPDIVIELMYLIYRYLFILSEVLHGMTAAAKSRMGYSGYMNSMRSMKGIGLNLFLFSFRKASMSYDSMTARGYDGKVRFWHPIKRSRKSHVWITSVYIGCLAGIFIFERILR